MCIVFRFKSRVLCGGLDEISSTKLSYPHSNLKHKPKLMADKTHRPKSILYESEF